MLRSDDGKRILRDKPKLDVTTLNMEYLSRLPSNSLGGAFASYMNMHGFVIGSRTKVKYIDDPELAYVMQRYRETHDILHTVCGIPVSVAGEVGLKWFEMVQTGLPMTTLAALFGTFKAENNKSSHLLEYISYCAAAARTCDPFFNIYFEKCWEEDIGEFRKRIRLPELPRHLPSLDASWDSSKVPALVAHYQLALETLQRDSDQARKEPFIVYLKNLEDLYR